jgi:hypothetical protein
MHKFLLLSLLLVCIGINAESDRAVASGTFVGMSGHEAAGGLSIYRDNEGYRVNFHKDFFFDGAPDPRLGFGKGKYLPATEFATLSHTQGAYEYRLPLTAKLEQYSEFWIWCEAYSVPIGRVDFSVSH